MKNIISLFVARIFFRIGANAEADYIGQSVWRKNQKVAGSIPAIRENEFSSVNPVASLFVARLFFETNAAGITSMKMKSYLGKKLLSQKFLWIVA